jgi:flagellar protein FlgJ
VTSMDGIKAADTALISSLSKAKEAKPVTKDPVQAATQFEALLLQEVMKSMWKTVPKGELISGSDEEDTYRDMLNEALAKSISEGQGIGIKEVILKDINKLQKK